MAETLPNPNEHFQEDETIVYRTADGFLTQSEAEVLTDVYYAHREEIEAHKRDTRYLEWGKWLVEHGKVSDGLPDGSLVLRKRLIHQPYPHAEWRLHSNHTDDDLPPAA